MSTQILTKELLNEYFEYKDGELYWKKTFSKKVKIGSKVGGINSEGYVLIGFNGKRYLAHRLIFLMHYGYLPKVIDHSDNNKLNNNIKNLRVATKAENGHNSKISKANTSKAKGVSWDKQRKKWVVHISLNCKNKFIGRYEDLELAELVAIEARDKYYGKFAKHQ